MVAPLETAWLDGPVEPVYLAPSNMSLSYCPSVANVVANRKPPAFTLIEQLSSGPYGDGKFGLVAHASAESIEHDPLIRLNASLAEAPASVPLLANLRLDIG